MRRGSLASFSLVFAWAVALALGGCLIDRGSLAAPSTGMDAGPSPDAFVAPGTDTGPPVDDPDAFVAPEIDAYVDPRPDAGLCDQVGETCCGASCNAGLSCSSTGRCDITGCGGVGVMCCLDSVCFGTNGCVDGTCMHCGARGEVCCRDGSCEGGLGCAGGNCDVCGDTGQACCGGSCRVGACVGGTCATPAGTRGGRCIDGYRCDALATCNVISGECEACGLVGEGCCPTGTDCASPLRCMGPVWERRCN